ncbi:MAG: hypothetical protein ACXVBL_00455 [Bdellovibrionota bacterium]
MKLFLIFALSFFLFRAVLAQADRPDFNGAKQSDAYSPPQGLR